MSELSGTSDIAPHSPGVAHSRSAPMDAADMRRRLKAIFIGSVGNLVEWYDFYAYAAFSLYFAQLFFPGGNPVAQQLNAALLFAFGFLVRPLGGILFGHLADRKGRRIALTLSVALMLPTTTPLTMAFFTATFAFTTPVGSTMRVRLSVSSPSTRPRTVRSSSPVSLPLMRMD